MGIVNYTYNRTTSGGEIVRELVNSTDGQGLHCDGAGYVDCGDTTILDGATRLSVETIVQPETKQAGFTTGSVLILGKSKAADCFTLGIDSDYKILFRVGTATATSSALTVGSVYHIAGTYDGATVKIYINGNLDGTATLASYAIPNTTDHLSIGRGIATGPSYSTYGFVGAVFRGRLWNKALSEAEIKDSYDNPSVKFSDQWGVEPAQNVSTCVNGSNPYTSFTSASATGFTAVQIGATASEAGTADEIALVNGKSYRVSFYIANTSQAPRVSFADSLTGTVRQELVGLATLTTGTQTYDITYTGATTTGVLKFDTTAAASYAISNLSITRTGVVADYDLAFANPTQSRMVQDRAGVADGTASASGVKQLTSIPQLNATAARIGTSQATPADGEVLVGSKLAIGGASASSLSNSYGQVTVNSIGDAADNATLDEFGLVVRNITDTTTETGIAFRISSNVDGATAKPGASITHERSGSGSIGDLHFKTYDGTDSATRMTIGSDGLLTTNGAATVDNLSTSAKLYNSAANTCGLQLVDNAGKACIQTSSGALQFWTDSETQGNNFVAGDLAMVIDSSGNVNIGDGTIPANTKLMVQGYVAGANVQTADTNKYFYITGVPYTITEKNSSIIGNDNFDGVNRVTIGGGSGNFNAATVIKFYTAADSTTHTGTERMQIDATGLATFSNGIAVTTGGVKFPATQSASADANVLDDYEEGSWSAVPAGGTSAGTYTSVYSSNTYTKIGRQVTVHWNIAWSGHTGSGDLQITGLPFASGGSGIGTFQCNSGLSWTAGYLPASYISGSTITFRNTDDGGSTYQMLQIAATGSYLRGTLTYFV